MMSLNKLCGKSPEEFEYTVRQIHKGFSKLSQCSQTNCSTFKMFIDSNPKEWSNNHLEKSVIFLSNLILNPLHTKRILFLFEPCALEIIRYALASEAHYQTKCSMLKIVLTFRPDVIHQFLSFFDDKNAPWILERLDSNQAKKKKFNDSEVPDLEIVESCWIFLKTYASYFKTKWNWGDFIEKFLSHNDDKVRWVSCQCISIILGMSEYNKMRLVHKYFSQEQHYQYLVEYEMDRQSADFSLNSDADLNPSRIFEPLFKQDVENLSVNVAGVYLPVFNPKKQKKEGCLVETKSTLHNLRKIAIGISTGKAVCLMGPVGSGKTSLISHLAMVTGRSETKDLLKVQLGEETDSKLLLGTYQCTDVPGEFVWSPGMLTKALLEGHWLLLEDIGSATSDVAALLSSLLEENSITIPGFKDRVQPTPGFHLFMTHRLVNSIQGYNRKEAYNTELLERHWVKVNLEPLTKEELTDVIQIKFPLLKTVASRMTSVFLLFSEGNHEGETTKIHYGSRLISTRDLFKWCSRAIKYFVVTSVNSTLKVLQDAIDIFCCSYSDSVARLELSGQIAALLGILKPTAEHFCLTYKPSVIITPTSCVAGRGVLARLDTVENISLKSLSEGMKYALTRTSCCLLERLAVCLSLNEPALLVGETGTGKTTTLQILAKQTGHTLVVINMNQQSDSSDLLGGYKPVDVKNIIMSLRDEFEELFRSFFNIKENLKFLENISICISKRKWSILLKMMLQSQKAAVKRLNEKNNPTLLQKWQQMGVKIHKLQLQIKNNECAMAFSFVEGALIHAMRSGFWVLLDEINLASAETLQCLSGLLEGSEITLLERGDEKSIPRHPNFRIMAAMNPATDFGKKDLPSGIRNRFTELFVSEHTEENDLILVVNCYLPDYPVAKVKAIVHFYLNVRKKAVEELSDGLGYRPHYSLRTLCRALVVASENKCGSMARSLYEALCLSFLTQLNASSYKIVRDMIAKTVADETDIKSILKQPIPAPTSSKEKFVSFEGYWVARGRNKLISSPNYIFTARVRRNLSDLARIVSLSSHPVLIQGETSVGKTSLIINMAEASGHKVFRINNHQHTDLQEYVGSYGVDPESGGLVFREGVLAQAMRNGDWVVLDELNLAPSEVLEALNRVLDDNRELFIPETSVTIKAHPDFRIFATQNPPGTYGGRKVLSRAFRNRFVELHFDVIPSAELEEILHLRCQMPLSYCKKLVGVMTDLQLRRKGSAAFAGKQGFITLRDLFRWGERYRRASSMDHLSYYDWDQHVAFEGYLILAGRVRKQEERDIIKNVIETRFKRVIDLNKLFTLNEETSLVTKHILEKIVAPPLPKGFEHLVWTFNLRVLAVLAAKALEFQEPLLLVGETGCGKTTICQLLAALNNQSLYSVNCHQHSESSDFLGGLRPVREKSENSMKLFEWVDGPLILAMKGGQLFLADEISLADDSVLERLNSLLEPERKLLVSEKGTSEEVEITAKSEFHFIGTMNPGGDFGKKELSPALRNRLTEIWCEGATNSDDIVNIVEHNLRSEIVFGDSQDGNTSGIGKAIVQFIDWFGNTEFGKRVPVSIRDILLWVDFINKTEGPLNKNGIDTASAYIYGAFLTFIDGVGAAQTSTENYRALEHFKNSCLEFLLSQANAAQGDSSVNLIFTPSLVFGNVVDRPDRFGVHPFYIKKAKPMYTKQQTLYQAPTVLLNLLRLMRALHVSSRAVLLEGSPGVGKTSLVLLIAKLTGYQVTRINLSEQTDISDLFGADLPVEGAEAGTFAWRDGPFLSALKNGHWILLDELNLASQSVVEGLNSVLDHRGEIYIPELGRTFNVKAGNTKLFACQNPQREGGARKGLPQSFLNRFAKVFFEPFNKTDLENLMALHFPNCELNIKQLVEFHCHVSSNKSWASPGTWEFNLRDLIRWGETLSGNYDPGVAVETIYASRMPAELDRKVILNMYSELFGEKFPIKNPFSPLLLSPKKLIIGDVIIPRDTGEDYYDSFNGKDDLLILRTQQRALKSLALCVKMGWMAIIVGKSGSGKTSLVHALAHLTGKKLHTIPVSSTMDTTDLLGGFEQVDYWRHLDRIGEEAERLVKWRIEKILLHSEDIQDASRLYDLWHQYVNSGVTLTTGYKLEEAEQRFKHRTKQLAAVLDALPDKNSKKSVTEKLTKLNDKVALTGLQGGGIFEWMDSVLIKCLETGRWLLLDNVNLCSGAVLDRLNSLLERQGVLALGERGEAEQVIKPHPNFRLFLTVNPKHGHISRAMRNRGVEIYLDVPDVKNIHPCDLDSLLSKRGVKSSLHKDIIFDIHQKVVDQEIGPEEPGLHHLLEVVFTAERSHQQGFPFYESLEQAFLDVYVKSRNLTSYQKESLQNFLKETLSEKKEALSQVLFTSVDCFYPEYKTLSTFYLQEDSLFGIAKLHGSLLYAILKNFDLSGLSANWPRPITIRDVVGERFSHEFSEHINLDCNILELLPYLVSSYYSCATHNDIETRALWLQGIVKYMERLQPRLKGHEVYEKMMITSNIVSGCILRFNQYQKDIPWDMRHVSTIVPFSESESWKFENKMITLIYYQFMCKTTNDEGIEVSHKNWRIMSALEYSKACGKGQIDDWPLQTPLIKSLYNLLMIVDYVVTTALSTNDVKLQDRLCARFIYDIAWRFKLSHAARRKLFLPNEKQPLLPLVNEDVVSLLELHYGWFRKHTYPIILKLIGKIADESRNGISLSQLVKEIDESLNFMHTSLLPVARKFRKSLTLPQPKTCPNQCDFAKLVHSFNSKVGLWNASNNNVVDKTNFLACSKGQETRKMLLQATITIHENKDLSAMPSMIKEIEASINSSSQCSNSVIKEITTVKLWPVLELVCLQLNSAMRKSFWTTEQTNDVSQCVIDSASSWYRLIDSIPPIAAALIQTISCRSIIPTEKEHVELNYFLFEHFNRSIALTSPITWLNWDETSSLTEDQIILESKALYGMHTPLYSLFLSKIFSNSSQNKDSPTFSLKAHKNTRKLFHLIKILLWRNLPGIFSPILDCSENDLICIKNNFTKLVKNFTAVVNSKIRDVSAIEGGEDLQRVFGRLKLELEEISRGGLLLQNQQRPEKTITAYIFKLHQITSEMKEGKSNVEKSMSCGLGWAYLGFLKLKLFSLLELVDPVKKKAIKMQYMSEEVSELHKLLSAEELMKITIGAPLSWPLKEQHEGRINELGKKYKGFDQSVAVRPATSLYSDIVKEISHLVSVLVSDDNFNNRLNSLIDLNKADVPKERKENLLAEIKSWLLSVTHYQEKLHNRYYTSYPDIIGPILMALAQIVYGVKLIYSAVEKEINQSAHRGNRSVDQLLKMLIIFPIADLKSAVEVVEHCSDVGLMNLLNKNEISQDSTNFSTQDNKIRLIKICIRIIKTLSRTYAIDKVKNTLFLILEHVVLCWNQIQEEEKVKKAQEDSIYINRMKLTEEEEAAKEISQLFPSSREDDFGDLEAPVALDYVPPTPTKKVEDPMKLKSVEIEDICQLHSLIVREQAQNHWLSREPVAEDNYVALLSDRLSVFSTLIDGLHGHCEKQLDQFSISSYLIAADLQTADIFKPIKENNHYDFYRDTNISESKQCIPLLNAIQKRVDELLVEWPDHPTLQQITTIIQRVTGFSMSSPLSRFLTGLELLLTKLHHWEENAHAGVSLAQHSASLTNQIIAWRKLELSAWKGALHSTYLKCEERARKWWFYLFSIVTAYIRNTETASLAEETENIVKTLQGYMETSSLGEFSVRLDLLYTFHCHALLFPSSQRQTTISSILWNLYNFYKLFKNAISKTILDLSLPIEKKLKDFVKIARWNDINYWSIKSAVEKTHHTLLKHIKEYEKILNEPARGAMIKIDIPNLNRKLNLSSLNPANFLTSLKMAESYKDLEGNENLLARLSSLLKRSNSICKQTITKCEYSKLIDNFELFVEEIDETGKLIQEFDIDTTIEKDKKKSIVKSLLQRKRKTVSDLFRTLTQIGLSYRSGLLMFEQNNTAFASLPPINIEASLQQIDRRKCDKDWLNCWKGSEQYFYSSVARLAMLKIALEKPHKDLGPQFIERIKGFTSHSNSLLHLLKEALCHSSENIYVIRCQLAQLLKLEENNYGLVSDSFEKNKLLLKSLLDDVVYCLKQFIVLLDACPEEEAQLTDIDQVPTIFPLPLVESMLSAFKYDTIWESTKSKVQSLLKSCLRMQDDISVLEKHSKLASSFNKNTILNADVLTNQSEFTLIEDCFARLGDIVVEITKIQQLFNQSVEGHVINNPLVSCLDTIILHINNAISNGRAIEFPSDKSITIDKILEKLPKNCTEKLETFINKVLCIIQNFYKKHVLKNEEAQEVIPKTDENSETTQTTEETEEVDADLIVDGHLKEKLVQSLLSDSKILRISEVSDDLADLFSSLIELEDEIAKESIQGLLFYLVPLLDQLVSIYHYFNVQLTAAFNVLGKFSSSLLLAFTEFSRNGYNVPDELREEEEGEGETKKGGLGLGEGEGEKDVSDQIESEDQLEDARKPGEYGQEEDKDCKEEEKGIEMSEDFGGKLQDIEKKDEEENDEDKEDEDEEEPDKEMGETEKGADTLDKQVWGSDSEEEPEDDDELPKDEKGNKGAEQNEKQLGAGEEEKEAVDDDEEKQPKKKEPKEKEINEMDEPEVDDDQIDPYHGKQQPSPEIEPLEIPDDEDMAVDEDDDKGSEGEDEKENPFDIDVMKKKIEEENPPEEDKPEEDKDKTEEAKKEEDKPDEDDELPNPELKKPEVEEAVEEEEEGSKQDEPEGKVEQEKEEEKVGAEEASGTDEKSTDQQAEQSASKEGSKDQVKNSEDMDVNMETEAEESQAEGREETGAGRAEKEDQNTGGHRGTAGKRKNAGESEVEEKKQKPGQSEIERSLGNIDEPVKKKLKTIGIQKENEEEKEEMETEENRIQENSEADLYQHIHEANKSQHDAQTIDAATQEQVEKQMPVIGNEEDEKPIGEEDIIEISEDEEPIDVETIDEVESTPLKDKENYDDKRKKEKGEGGGIHDEATIEVEGEYSETFTVPRGYQSTFHTQISELEKQMLSEADKQMLRQELEKQLASWNTRPVVQEASEAWEKICSLTSSLAQQLSEELRLVLEPTTASSLKGDFRTGKRINMRKVIPYIASQFRKDKIWLRRTKPSKREYQIILAIDDSSSMADNHSKELAFESLAVVSKALNLLEAGDLAVISFGEAVRVLHQLGETFTESSGARLMQEFSFDQKKTRVAAAVEAALGLVSQRGPDSAQLLVIISDGRGVMSEGERVVRSAVRKANHTRLFIVFIIIDNPKTKDSVLDIRLPVFKGPNVMEIKPYMDAFPFPFYLILRDINNLPSVLSDALRQWFELVTDMQ